MSRRHSSIAVAAVLALVLAAPHAAPVARAAAASLTATIDDAEFWRMVSDFSERPGAFQSDNLLSNERELQYVIPELASVAATDGVYLGVGPEQNFTYIAALKPKLAFIIDVRRGNLDLHLMYKALFELSADRADFVSRLFSRPRPQGLTTASSATEIFNAFGRAEPSDTLYSHNLRAIVNQLQKIHGFVLSSADTLRLQHIYTAIYTYGPAIQYSTTQNAGRWRSSEPTYTDLMVATDLRGDAHGFLSSEERFRFMKQFETDNRLVPLVGNFAGPRSIRAVGEYLREHGATVSAFYVSNVEDYLRQDGLWKIFCANVATLPLGDASTFIRAVRSDAPALGFGLTSQLGPIAAAVNSCESN